MQHAPALPSALPPHQKGFLAKRAWFAQHPLQYKFIADRAGGSIEVCRRTGAQTLPQTQMPLAKRVVRSRTVRIGAGCGVSVNPTFRHLASVRTICQTEVIRQRR
jgi:hypothetical protein